MPTGGGSGVLVVASGGVPCTGRGVGPVTASGSGGCPGRRVGTSGGCPGRRVGTIHIGGIVVLVGLPFLLLGLLVAFVAAVAIGLLLVSVIVSVLGTDLEALLHGGLEFLLGDIESVFDLLKEGLAFLSADVELLSSVFEHLLEVLGGNIELVAGLEDPSVQVVLVEGS